MHASVADESPACDGVCYSLLLQDDHFTGCVDSVNVNSNPLPLLSPNTPPEYAVPCGPR